MKKFGRKLAIVLAMMMIFTSFEFVGVFADEPEGEPVVTEETGNGESPATVGEDVDDGVVLRDDDNQDPSDSITEEDLAIEDLALLSGYNCVVLRWKKIDVENVEYYVDGEKVSVSDYNYVSDRLTGDYVMYKFDNKPASETTYNPGYQYTVQAKADGIEGVAATSNLRAPVRTIAYSIRVKKGTTLKKHGGNGPSTYKLKKGQELICYGFGGGGCYMFKYKGSIFYCAKIRAKKQKAIYTTGWNYTPEEAELFINQKPDVSSKTTVYLWCSQYTQHFYFMDWDKESRQWKCTDDWECSSGKPSSPSPTGMYGLKKIEGKWKKHHNIKWWSKFSGTNSVHGKKPKWTFGRPKSNGCVRNPVDKAYKVYRWAYVGTGLLMY